MRVAGVDEGVHTNVAPPFLVTDHVIAAVQADLPIEAHQIHLPVPCHRHGPCQP